MGSDVRGGSPGQDRTERAVTVERTGRVLDAFDFDHPTLGMSELARRARLAKATTHRLAGQMVDEGFLERADRGYRLGERLFEWGQRVPGSRSLRDAALPFLEDLFVASRETVHLAALSGDEVLYIDKLVGHSSGRTPSQVAGRMPLHSTATGKAMMAHMSDERIDALLDRPLRRLTRHTITVAHVLRSELETVRAVGWSVEREETVVGYVSVAAPVFDRRGQAYAALAVTGPAKRVEADRFGPAVRTAARALTRALRGGAPMVDGGNPSRQVRDAPS